ncbi:unnamed protein product [Ceutorhynchus assimilis]|uniref:Carboxypeptidase n=1 Tax=Ceutorhynchus assimilis TaxID=467358 RepID=A0A9N9MUJ2_9CUCU|nr:unnamed protein product [Ceutorhynchus assimilis]
MTKLILLFLVAIAIQLVSAKFPFYTTKAFTQKPVHDLEDPLILTPLLKQGQIEAAKEAAKVDLVDFQNVTSYAGYLTVDEPNNGNLFFWFFPSANDYGKDPVLLWLQGGPGSSSLFGLFAEHGPFIVENNTVSLREYSWHKNYSVLYIDQPVGTGFSFTDGDYVTNQTQVGNHLYTGLVQFFTLFPELQKLPFYVSGESYGGKYVPAISYTIHQRNPSADLKINLQGVIIGNGLSDPLHQFDYGDLLYQLGLIDLPTLKEFYVKQNNTVSLIKQGNFHAATDGWNEIVNGFSSNTALDDIYNFIKDTDDSPTEWTTFVTQDRVRKALHVGSAQYSDQNYDVYDGLYADISRSVAPWVSELLNHYRVLIFNGQLDIIVGYVLTANYLQNLEFSAAAEYKLAERQIWTVGESRIAGYVKIAGNLTEVMVRNAGHMVPSDQPEAAFDLINRFIDNRFD